MKLTNRIAAFEKMQIAGSEGRLSAHRSVDPKKGRRGVGTNIWGSGRGTS